MKRRDNSPYSTSKDEGVMLFGLQSPVHEIWLLRSKETTCSFVKLSRAELQPTCLSYSYSQTAIPRNSNRAPAESAPQEALTGPVPYSKATEDTQLLSRENHQRTSFHDDPCDVGRRGSAQFAEKRRDEKKRSRTRCPFCWELPKIGKARD
jgi:hypothetical protein